MRRTLAAGNWKMNGDAAMLEALRALQAPESDAGTDILICPPATLLAQAVAASAQSPVAIGGQDSHSAASGAHTGDISAAMIKATGASAVIVGHSERRADHGETNAQVRAKVQAAWGADLLPILCIGESEAERMGENTLDIIATQLDAAMPDGATGETLVIAGDIIHMTVYQFDQPGWGIGFDIDSGKAAETRKTFFDQAASDKLLFAGAHIPFPGMGRVAKDGDAYRFVAAGWPYAY